MYHFRSRCILRDLGSRHVLMVYPSDGQNAYALQINDSFAMLFRRMYGTSFTQNDIILALTDLFSLPPDTALAEAATILRLWQEQDLISIV